MGRKQPLPKNIEEGAIWFHCASLGEFEQARPVIEKTQSNFPTKKILLTFFSPSGYEIRKTYEHADYICYLPFDSRSAAKEFINHFKPSLALFVKYEFWYFFYNELQLQNTPIISFSTILRPKQIFFKPWGSFNRKILKLVDFYFVQNRTTIDLLNSIGIRGNVVLAGDTRFDRVYSLSQNPQQINLLEHFKGSKKLLVLGSSWNSDLKIILPVLKKFESKIKIIIAPHEIHDNEINNLVNEFKECTRYTKSSEGLIINSNVLILDTIGMLSSAYNYGEIAYIGGAFGSGLHNTLEPCTYGCSIIFGPKYSKFQEAIDLIEQKGAFSISNTQQFEGVISKMISDNQFLENIKTNNINYIKNNIGATDLIYEKLQNLL